MTDLGWQEFGPEVQRLSRRVGRILPLHPRPHHKFDKRAIAIPRDSVNPFRYILHLMQVRKVGQLNELFGDYYVENFFQFDVVIDTY